MEHDDRLGVLRVYHAGRNAAHRGRERSLRALGVDVTLVVPTSWPEGGGESRLSTEDFPIVELSVDRPADVNRHRYSALSDLKSLIQKLKPDVLDLHEEPFSLAARQWLAAAPPDLPIVMYTAQNVDKRFPPPFAQYERAAHRRVAALYPCSAQAAAVARGKGFAGLIEVLPLGYDDALFVPGVQSLEDDEIVLTLVGRLVPEKGVTEAVRVLAKVNAVRPARLILSGAGPEAAPARALAGSLGVADRLEILPWQPTEELAATYRKAHFVLVPSRPTETWVEQFGRVIVEAQASGAVVAGYSTGAIPEVAGKAAVLSNVGALSDLVDRILRIVTDAGAFSDRREAGLALSKTRTWSHVAERHGLLYRRVVAQETRALQLPRSPQRRRAAAHAEYGSTAATIAGARPFALPLLRRGGAVASFLARGVDTAAELRARIGA